MTILRLIATGALLLLTVTFAQAQKLPTKSEQYEFLGWYAKNSELLALSGTSAHFIQKKLLDTKGFIKLLSEQEEFTITDIKYIKAQIPLVNKRLKLDTAKLKGAIWNAETEKSSAESFISFPVFNSKKDIAFIYKAFYCGGECGYETIEMYIKTSPNSWRKYEKIQLPIIMY